MIILKRKIKWNNVFKALILLLIVIALFVIFIKYTKSNDIKPSNVEENNKSVLETASNSNLTSNENSNNSLTLVMVGDNLIHDKIYKEFKTSTGYDFSPMLSYMKEIIPSYDLAYYNQETILGGSEIGLSSYPTFNSPYEVGDNMIDIGFNLVSLATNHTLDRGKKAIVNSLNYWSKKSDVLTSGSYLNLNDRNKANIKIKNGISYAMLNYTYGTNGIAIPNGENYLVNVWPVTGSNPKTDTKYQQYKQQVKEDIASIRGKTDLLIVAMHWGTEYKLTPNSYQKDMANYLASLGVDIVIGTHPHVIEPIEWIGDTLVIYSLGNFVSAHEVINMDNRVGLMTSLTVNKNTEGKIKIENVDNELLYMYYTNDYHNFKVIQFSKLNDNLLKNYKNYYNKYKNIVTSLDNTISVKGIE